MQAQQPVQAWPPGLLVTGAPLRRRCTRAANSPSPRMLKNVPTASEILPRKDTFESVMKWLLRGSVKGRAVLGRRRLCRVAAGYRVADIDARRGVTGWLGGPAWAWPSGPHPVFYLSGAAASAKGRNGVARRVMRGWSGALPDASQRSWNSSVMKRTDAALMPCCTEVDAATIDTERRQGREITHEVFRTLADKMLAHS